MAEMRERHEEIVSRSAFHCYAILEGWNITEDCEISSEFLSVEQLELVPVLRNEEEYLGGKKLIARAKEMGAILGQKQAEYLLKHQEEIPPEWGKYYLAFPGTVWSDRYGARFIPCLCRYGYAWYLLPLWLGYFLCSDVMLLRARKG